PDRLRCRSDVPDTLARPILFPWGPDRLRRRQAPERLRHSPRRQADRQRLRRQASVGCVSSYNSSVIRWVGWLSVGKAAAGTMPALFDRRNAAPMDGARFVFVYATSGAGQSAQPVSEQNLQCNGPPAATCGIAGAGDA